MVIMMMIIVILLFVFFIIDFFMLGWFFDEEFVLISMLVRVNFWRVEIFVICKELYIIYIVYELNIYIMCGFVVLNISFLN